MLNKILTLGITLFMFTSCANDSEDDVADMNTGGEMGDTTITYEKDISGLMAASCTRCHGTTLANGAPFSLTTYEEVKAKSEGIAQTIQALNGKSLMPPGAALQLDDINLVKQWIEGGLLEN